MITEDYVSFEISKLLKEKGFDCACKVWYSEYTSQFFGGKKYTSIEFDDHNRFDDNYKFICYAPTLQMAIKWIEEVHHILVVVDYIYECTSTSWVYKIYRLGENGKPERCIVKGTSYDDENNPTEHIVGYRDYELSYKDYATREEAEDEGIRYVLENLI